jgi:hypothetical protein
MAAGCILAANPCLPNDLPEPASWVPATARFIAYVDLASLLSSPSFKGLESYVARQISSDELESFRALTGMDPWRDFHVLCFFIEDAPEGERTKELWGVAISGAFDVERVLESMDERLHLERRKYRETPIYVILDAPARTALGEGPHALAFPDGSTALLGPLASVERMLDAALGFEPSSGESPLKSGLDEISTGEAFWAVGAGQRGLEEGLRLPHAAGNEIPSLLSYAISLRTGTEIRIRAWAEAKSSEDANALADLLRGVLALGAMSPLSTSPGPALESVEIEAVDDRLEASFEIDGRDVRRWLLGSERPEAVGPLSPASRPPPAVPR